MNIKYELKEGRINALIRRKSHESRKTRMTQMRAQLRLRNAEIELKCADRERQ
jgi:hypothetical protein